MPKGRGAPRRETKKSKRKKEERKVIEPLPVFTSADVELVGKRRKPKEEE